MKGAANRVDMRENMKRVCFGYEIAAIGKPSKTIQKLFQPDGPRPALPSRIGGPQYGWILVCKKLFGKVLPGGVPKKRLRRK